jgi:hypothetical protein
MDRSNPLLLSSNLIYGFVTDLMVAPWPSNSTIPFGPDLGDPGDY